MRRHGIHSFVWTGGQTQDRLEMALRKSAEHGYRAVEFAYLRPEAFNLDRLATLAQSLDVDIGVTMGLPLDKDISSEDVASVAAGKAMLEEAVRDVSDIGGTTLGGIPYSAHTKNIRQPTGKGWDHLAAVIGNVSDLAHGMGLDLVVEVVNRFETNLLNTTAQGLKFLNDAGSARVRLHLDTFPMNIDEASPAAAIRLAGDIVFESLSTAVVDESLSLACAIWRDTWTDSDPLAAHASSFIELKMAEARRRSGTNACPGSGIGRAASGLQAGRACHRGSP